MTACHPCACLYHCMHHFIVPQLCVSFSHGTASSLRVGPDFFLFVIPGSSTCLAHIDPQVFLGGWMDGFGWIGGLMSGWADGQI